MLGMPSGAFDRLESGGKIIGRKNGIRGRQWDAALARRGLSCRFGTWRIGGRIGGTKGGVAGDLSAVPTALVFRRRFFRGRCWRIENAPASWE